MKIDSTVKKEVIFVAAFSFVFSTVMELVFIALNAWKLNVLLGNLLGYSASVLNFLLMGLTVQKAVLLDEEEGKKKIRISQSLRLLMLVLFSAAAIIFSNLFSLIPYLISLLFPRFSITVRQILINKQ